MLRNLAATLMFLLLSGAALTGALMITRTARLDRERRVNLVAVPQPASKPVGTRLKGGMRSFDTQLHQVFVARAGRCWGMKAHAYTLITIALIAAMTTWLLLHTAIGLSWWLSLLPTALAAFVFPRILLLRQQRAAEQQFTDLFPGSIDSISRMLRAGLPITSAVHTVAREAPQPVGTVFATLANQIEIGVPIEQALDVSSRQIGLPDFRFFTVAVVLQHATGGNLAETLEVLSDIIRRRRAVRLKAKATTAEVRVSGYVLGSLPFMIVGALTIIQPGYLTPLFVDPRGQVILAIAIGGLLLAGLSMRQMMRSVTNV